MPICAKCGNEFPRWMILEGKYRSFTSRKYCLDCSPFNRHNTKQLHQPQDDNPHRICRICGRRFDYAGKHNKPGHRKAVCNSCRTTVRAQQRKQAAVTYKGGKCIRCGYNKFLEALCFHHRDADEKEVPISYALFRSWEFAKAELNKCDLLCLNCHAEVHAEASHAGEDKKWSDTGDADQE